MKYPFRLFIRAVIFVNLVAVTSLHVQAGGFQISEQSVTGLGRAFSGYGVVGDDVSAVFYNPAGLMLLEGTQAQSSLYYLNNNADFENQGSTRMGAASTGTESDGGREAIVSGLYFASDVIDRVKVGLGLTVPYGLVTDYDDDWIGRFHALRSELKTIDINPSIAFRINDHLSIGAGFSAQFADVTLSRAVFLINPATLAPLPDGFVRAEGDDWGYGYNVGFMYEHNADSRFGVGYRSRIHQNLEGKRFLDTVVPALSGTIDDQAELDLPDTMHLGGFHRVNDQWSFTFGARWTNWSRFDEIRISFADGSPDAVTPENWEDSWTVNVGANYDYNPNWTFRIGYAFDETPVPSAELRTPRVPDEDRHWATVGASFHYGEHINIEFGYAHLFVEETRINTTIDLLPNTAPGLFMDTLVGEFDSSSDIVGVQGGIRF